MSLPKWLPELVKFEKYGGVWDNYLTALYEFFVSDFIINKTNYRGITIGIKKHPLIDGKEATFWHLITESDAEKERTPDLSRCERIRWPKPIIENATIPEIKVWQNHRFGETRLCIWFEEAEYLVVLAERKNYLLIWTAYTVTRNHRKRKLLKEYEDSLKN